MPAPVDLQPSTLWTWILLYFEWGHPSGWPCDLSKCSSNSARYQQLVCNSKFWGKLCSLASWQHSLSRRGSAKCACFLLHCGQDVPGAHVFSHIYWLGVLSEDILLSCPVWQPPPSCPLFCLSPHSVQMPTCQFGHTEQLWGWEGVSLCPLQCVWSGESWVEEPTHMAVPTFDLFECYGW